MATVQLDLDGEWVVREHLGRPGRADPDAFHRGAFPRFLRLFAEAGVRATLFVIARDLEIDWKRDLVVRAAEAGHEIASHGLGHPVDFDRLPEARLREEVEQSARAIAAAVGARPAGFRAPSFLGSPALLDLLEASGYRYDSSLLPTPFSPLLRRLKARLAGTDPATFSYMAEGYRGFLPRGPYRPSRDDMWRRGDRPLWEVPVNPFPLVPFPFHASYILALSARVPSFPLFAAGTRILRAFRIPLNYPFHLADLAEPRADPDLAGHPGMETDLARKEALCRRVLASLTARFEILPTVELVDRLETRDDSPTPSCQTG